MNKQPYRKSYQSRNHLTGEHYVPDRTRDPNEAERRHSLPGGTILAEQQRDGLIIASSIMGHEFENPRDNAFITEMLGASAFNASWYAFARKITVPKTHRPPSRRVIDLPELADDDADWRETRSGLLTKIRQGLAHTAGTAEQLVTMHISGHSTERLNMRLGQQMARHSLQLACLEIANAPRGMSAFDIQDTARERSLDAQESARTLTNVIGIHPSVAQLANPDSPLSVHWRRNAPDSAYNAYEQGLEEFRAA
jgi:hypothetical protein